MKRDASSAADAARAVVRRLREQGHEAFWVGGCVRDLLLGRPPKDYDVATSARPDQVQALFRRTVDVGRAFGVIQVLDEGPAVDVATFREDAAYGDGRHPDAVRFADAAADARRRDFTINALLYDPVAGEVVDLVDGRRDLQARVVRAIGEPAARFREDYLRMLRAVRFASVLEFRIDPATWAAIRELAPRLRDVSAERVQQELTRLLCESPRPGDGLRLLLDSGLLEVILPEAARLRGQEQPPQFHPEGDVFTHTVNMLNAMRRPDPELAYAVLLHDIGKPATAYRSREADGSERIRFDGHAHVGADLAEDILLRLKLPRRTIEVILHAVRHHMRFMDVRHMRRGKLRRLVGAPTFPLELELHRLDCLASHGALDNYEFLRRFVEELEQEPVLPPPWINGHDVMALGVAEGREVGRRLRQAYDAQLEGRYAGREELLSALREELARDAPPGPGPS